MRKLFAQYGFDPHRDIEVIKAPSGRGAASHWVIKQIPSVRAKATAERHQRHLGFLVVCDGDREGWASRLASLFPATGDDRTQHENLAFWVPTWSIETWVAWLCSWPNVNEGRSLKDEFRQHDYGARLEQAVAGWANVRADEEAYVPSLGHARRELKRLPHRP